jgi:FkbM family methyltransferase
MKHAARLVKLVRRFGLRKGASLFLLHAWHCLRRTSGSVAIEVEQLPQAITLRPTTSDWAVFEKIFVELEYDIADWPIHARAIARYASRLKTAQTTPLIIDCGANIGLAAIWYAREYPDAHVIAIEPEPSNFALLLQNTRGYPNITSIMAAISDHCGFASLTNDENSPWAWRTDENRAGQTVLTTIPQLLAKQAGGEMLIVKLDIEGAEQFLFRSHTDWLRDLPLIVFESHDWLFPGRGTAHAILSCLVKQSRDYLQKGENTFSMSHALFEPVADVRPSEATLQPSA